MLLSRPRAFSIATICAAAPLAVLIAPNAEAASNIEASELVNLSLEELSNVSVTSVSKRPEKETEAAAAIYVITQEDIRRSGATAIPELLRMAPGLTVTRSGARDWTVTSRGFNGQFSNKLLVLMDGRTVYSPLFSGVIWDLQDTILEDIERIEVIRGPGATLWGANAVNGVINIITKNAKDTQGGLATALAGTQIDGIAGLRYGGKTGDDSYLRAYAKRTAYASETAFSGNTAGDAWKKSQAGFRSDSKLSDSGKLTFQGDVYSLDANTDYVFPDINSGTLANNSEGLKAKGGNLLARWENKLSTDSETSVQVYFDNTSRESLFFHDENNTVDLDFQHLWTRWKGNEIVWGAGYRFINSKNDPTSQQYALSPQKRNDNLFNAFVQDKITLNPDDLFLTLGSKFEDNDYTGIEIQPSARLTWLPSDTQTVWASVSRAVHTPSRVNSDGQYSIAAAPAFAVDPLIGIPTLIVAGGNRDLESEELIAYELGYRIQPTKSVALDATAFYNDYSKLFNGAYGAGTVIGGGAYYLLPIIGNNLNSGYSTGIELAATAEMMDNWKLEGAYSYLNLKFDRQFITGFSFSETQPRHQFNVRSTYLLPHNIEMNNALYFVDNLYGVGVRNYFRFDTMLSYEILKGVNVSLVGQNLLDDRHQEFSPFLYQSSAEIGRSVFASVAFKF
jgi:iron complex outermembrane receptor protein